MGSLLLHPSCESHSIVAQTSTSVQCSLVLSNCDSATFSQSKDTFCNKLASKLSANSKNVNCKVTVTSVQVLAGGKLGVNYACNGLSDVTSAIPILNNCFLQNNFIGDILQSVVGGVLQGVSAIGGAVLGGVGCKYLLLNC